MSSINHGVNRTLLTKEMIVKIRSLAMKCITLFQFAKANNQHSSNCSPLLGAALSKSTSRRNRTMTRVASLRRISWYTLATGLILFLALAARSEAQIPVEGRASSCTLAVNTIVCAAVGDDGNMYVNTWDYLARKGSEWIRVGIGPLSTPTCFTGVKFIEESYPPVSCVVVGSDANMWKEDLVPYDQGDTWQLGAASGWSTFVGGSGNVMYNPTCWVDGSLEFSTSCFALTNQAQIADTKSLNGGSFGPLQEDYIYYVCGPGPGPCSVPNSDPACLGDDTRTDCFVRDSLSTIQHDVLFQGTWYGLDSLPGFGSFSGPPSCVEIVSGQIDCVARSTKNEFLHISGVTQGGSTSWSASWNDTGVAGLSDPTCLDSGQQQIDCYAVGVQYNVLLHLNPYAPGWQQIGNIAALSRPDCVTGLAPGQIDCFVVGPNHDLWHTGVNNGSPMQWTDMGPLSLNVTVR